MTEWEPATEAEVAMRDALRAQDQELYFRILTRTELLLPVSAEALAGTAPMGWGTWTTGGRTHVLAFTSAAALRACLGESAGTSRRIPYADLAAEWPNHEWWLAVNPGLPIEGYLPAWFVAQLARGDVRLPGRTMGARARLDRAETAARARKAAATGSGMDAPVSPAPVPAAPRTAASATPGGSTPAAAPPPEPSTVPIPTAPARPSAVVPPSPAPPPPAPPASVPLARPTPSPAAVSPTQAVAPAVRPSDPATQPATGRVAPPHRTEDVGNGTPSRPAPGIGAGEPGGSRSFFEPASGRTPRRASLDQLYRAGERAVPPSRLGQGGQPFPRRRPLNEPVPAEETQALRLEAPADQTQVLTPPSREPAADETRTLTHPRREPAADETQALTRPHREPSAEEPTRAFHSTVPAGGEEATQTLPRRRPPVEVPEADERTRIISRPFREAPPSGAGEEAEELPPSIAEPVSAPPAPRRTLSPIVIEGTVIESRDLTETEPPQPPGRTPWAERPSRSRSEPPTTGDNPAAAAPVAVPTVPAAAPATASALPAASAADDEPATPWTGSDQATVSIAAAPSPPPAEPAMPATSWAGQPEPDEPTAPAPADTADPADLIGATVRAGGAEPPGREEPTGREEPAPADFVPANEVEEDLLGAAGSGSTDTFLSTLLLARVLLPVAPDSAPASRPDDAGFVWRTEELDGETYVVVYTSPERLADRADGPVETVSVKFVQLIRRWPDEAWSFAVNPGTPVGAKYPGEQVVGLANWAAEVGLGDDPETEPEQPAAEPEPASRTRYAPAAPDPSRPVTMQKAVAPSQLAYYLERGYDRVSGFVHRASELAHLTTPAQLYDALGLNHADSPFSRGAEEIYLLRWPAHRPSLYRIPYGGQNEAAMRAMEGWVIERPPFRGNGFAPGESSDVVAEFKVDSARLPHGAQLWRVGVDGTERVIAILDTDALLWRQVGEP